MARATVCHTVLTYTVIDKLPEEIKPSVAYKTTFVTGAEEVGLPEDYIAFLKAIAHEDPL